LANLVDEFLKINYFLMGDAMIFTESILGLIASFLLVLMIIMTLKVYKLIFFRDPVFMLMLIFLDMCLAGRILKFMI